MLRHNVPVRRDLDRIAADNGFDFHIIDKSTCTSHKILI